MGKITIDKLKDLSKEQIDIVLSTNDYYEYPELLKDYIHNSKDEFEIHRKINRVRTLIKQL